MKAIRSILVTCFIAGCSIVHAYPNALSDEQEVFDTEEFFDAFELTEEDMIVPSTEDILRKIDIGDFVTGVATSTEAFPSLQRQIDKASQLLVDGLYRRTNPVMSRNVLDLPAISYIMPQPKPVCHTHIRSFYNHTDSVAFCGQQETIDAVTNLGKDSLVQAVESLVNLSSESLDFDLQELDIPNTLPLFSDIQLQARRAGLMFEHVANGDQWMFAMQLPVYYMEHNFFATDAVRRRIENAPAIQKFSESGTDDGSAAEAFFKNHLVADRFGVGDIRVTLLHTIDYSPLAIWSGLEVTLPTAFDFEQGLIGGEFPKRPPQPQGILRQIINTLCVSSQRASELAMDELFKVLDRVTRIFADRPLGQEHFGIAPVFSCRFNGAACDITGKARIEYLTPRTRPRFFIRPASKQELRNPDYTDEDISDQNFDFLEDKVINALLPRVHDVDVKPCLSPQISATIGQSFDTWRWHSGCDFWYYMRERIHVPNEIRADDNLRVSLAERPRAYQLKLFADVNMDVATKRYLWHVGLGCDGTIACSGIGNDFTLSLYAGTSW